MRGEAGGLGSARGESAGEETGVRRSAAARSACIALAALTSHAWGAARVALEATVALVFLEVTVYLTLYTLCNALVWLLDHERG